MDVCNSSVDFINDNQCLPVWRLTGHIGIAVPDVYAACKLFEEQGVTFVKKPNDGEEIKLEKLISTFFTRVFPYLPF